MPPYEWRFEPCDPEAQKSPNGAEYTHATRGIKPVPGHQTARITGYGFTQPEADVEARKKARMKDAYEVVASDGRASLPVVE